MVENKLILGTVQFGLKYGINNTSGKPGQEEVNKILLKAYEAGVRCLDTAEAYGDAHDVIGRFHTAYPEIDFNIITKLPHIIDNRFEKKINEYLEQLSVIKLKGILFHSYKTYKDHPSAIETLNKYKAEGKVESIGVSIYTNEQMEDVMADDDIDIIQLPFNLFDNINLRGEIIREAKKRGKTIHSRSAFLQGLFFASLNDDRAIVKALLDELRYINEFSKSNKISLQKLALNYCLQQSDIDQVLIGVDNFDQLNRNLMDADCSLSENDINNINKILVKDINLLNPSLWN